MGCLSKRLLTLAIIVSCGLGIPAQAAPSIQSLQMQSSSMQQKLLNTRRQTQQLRRQEKAARNQLGAIRQNLNFTTTRLQDTRFRLSVARTRLTFLSRDLTKVQRTYGQLRQAAAERLRFLQQQRPEQWWALLLASRDLNMMMDRRYQLGRVFERDHQILVDLENQRRAVLHKRMAVEGQKNDIALIAQQLTTRQSQFQQQASVQTDLVKRISTQRAAYEAAERRLAADSRRISAMIRTLIASRRQFSVVQGSGRMAMPVDGRFSSSFGPRFHPIFRVRRMHTGMDIAAPSGSAIRAADDGTVLFAGWYGGYGRCVVISHGGELSTLYGHASRLYVSAGQAVQKGQPIAAVGSTGFATGPHLHFEVRVNGAPVNPLSYLR